MPTSKPKSNVAKSAKKSSFKFRWWYAVIAVLVVAVVGIAVLRFSHASAGTSYTIYIGNYDPSSKPRTPAFRDSRLYDMGAQTNGTLQAMERQVDVQGKSYSQFWAFSPNPGEKMREQKIGCLKTTNSKYVSTTVLTSQAGPYQFVETTGPFQNCP